MDGAVGVFCLVVGVVMVAWWGVDLRGGALDRPDRARAEIGLHLLAELLTAGLLVAGGAVLLGGGGEGLALVALGMLAYTTVASPGYFLARGERGPVAVFAVLVVLTIGAVVGLLAT